MAIKNAVHQYLAGKASVTTLVPAARIVRGKRPIATTLPCVTFVRVSETDEDQQGGAAGLAMIRLQMDIWSTTDTEAESIRLALRNVLHGLQHQTIGSGGDATAVQAVVCENSTDLIEWPEDGTDPAKFSCSMDVVIWYNSTIPNLT